MNSTGYRASTCLGYALAMAMSTAGCRQRAACAVLGTSTAKNQYSSSNYRRAAVHDHALVQLIDQSPPHGGQPSHDESWRSWGSDQLSCVLVAAALITADCCACQHDSVHCAHRHSAVKGGLLLAYWALWVSTQQRQHHHTQPWTRACSCTASSNPCYICCAILDTHIKLPS
jgi:hypothetical protein